MPNHVTNRVTVTGDAKSMAELTEGIFVKRKREVPEHWLEMLQGPAMMSAEQHSDLLKRIAELEAEDPYDVLDFNRIVPAPAFIFAGESLVGGSREEETRRNWYVYNNERWGTKWNAYDLSISERAKDRLVFTFDTAWREPKPVMAELAFWFPELTIRHEFICEGHCFFGTRTYVKGRNVSEIYITDSSEAPEFAKRLCIELQGYDPSDDDEDE